jgi:hypothetical protein
MPVKLVYDKYTISLRRLTTMLETGDTRMIKKHWYCPWFVRNRGYKAIMKDVNNIFGDGDKNQGFDDMNLWLYMDKKRLIIEGALLSVEYEFGCRRCNELYLSATGCPLPELKENATAELKKKLNSTIVRMNSLSKHISEIKEMSEESNDETTTLSRIIEKIGIYWLEQDINRNIMLFEFEDKYKEAIEKAKHIKDAQ